MDELEARLMDDDPGVDEPVELCVRGLLGRLADDGDGTGVVAAAQHRQCFCCGHGARFQPGQAESGDRGRRSALDVHAVALQPGRSRHLRQQGRIATAGPMEGVDQGLGEGARFRPAGEPSHRGAGQRSEFERDQLGAQFAEPLPRDRVRLWLFRLGLPRPAAQGQRQQDRQPVEAPGQVAEKAGRGCIAPLQVVDQQREGRPAREPPDQPVQALQDGG